MKGEGVVMGVWFAVCDFKVYKGRAAGEGLFGFLFMQIVCLLFLLFRSSLAVSSAVVANCPPLLCLRLLLGRDRQLLFRRMRQPC